LDGRSVRAAIVLVLACFEGCGRGRADSASAGTRVLGTERHRVISLVPSATDMMVALGVADRLVARTDYDTGAWAATVPSVGGMIDPSMERIVALKPDLVLVMRDSSSAAVTTQLATLGIPVEQFRQASFEDVRETLARLGTLFAVRGRADSLREAIDDTLAAVRSRVAGKRRIRVFFVAWPSPLITTGGGTFVDSLITVAGGTNVFGDEPIGWPTVSFEALVRRRPDLILWPVGASTGAARERLSSAQWRSLAAVRSGRVAFVDRDLIVRSGPRMGEAGSALARLLHEAPDSGNGPRRVVNKAAP
jgi:iron complex transport system substrate-binding protein